jgi:hypothetical protein
MALTRRQILRGVGAGAALLAGATITGTACAATRRDVGPSMPDVQGAYPYTLDFWRGLVGSTLATIDDPHLNLTIVSVRDLRHIADENRLRGSGDMFIVALRETNGHPLNEGIVALYHPTVGRFDLHIGPSGPGSDYQAAINRWLPAR